MIFTSALTWFLWRTVPTSRKAKPPCIAKTRIAPRSTKKTSSPTFGLSIEASLGRGLSPCAPALPIARDRMRTAAAGSQSGHRCGQRYQGSCQMDRRKLGFACKDLRRHLSAGVQVGGQYASSIGTATPRAAQALGSAGRRLVVVDRGVQPRRFASGKPLWRAKRFARAARRGQRLREMDGPGLRAVPVVARRSRERPPRRENRSVVGALAMAREIEPVVLFGLG